MIRPTLINLNPFELNYYTFMINLDKCNGSCNATDDLSAKISVPSKKKDINVKVFNMITKINEAKPLIKHLTTVQHVIQIKNGIMNVNVSVKICELAQKHMHL